MRKPLTATLATILFTVLLASPAAAKTEFAYVATIDCGSGSVVVGSQKTIWSALEELETGRTYKPVEWHLTVGGRNIDIVKPGEGRERLSCSYDDGEATGTVVVDVRHRAGD